MKVRELTEGDVPYGTRIRVTGVAWTQPEEAGYIDDTKRLMGATGVVISFSATVAQLTVKWDDPKVGSLMLAGEDEVEVIRPASW